MKLHPGQRDRGGFTLLIVMVFLGVGFLLLSNLLRLSSSGSLIAERHSDYQNATVAAEAATEKVVAEIARQFQTGGLSDVDINLASMTTLVPTAAEDGGWGSFEFTDGAGALGATHIQKVADWAYGPLAWKYVGDVGFAASYRVISNARRAAVGYGPMAGVRQEIQVAEIPLFGFGVFYGMDLEVCSGQDFTVPGRVHSNGNIYVEPDLRTVTFEGNVTSVRQISHESHPLDPVGRTFGNVTYAGARDSHVGTLAIPIGAPNDPLLLHKLIEIPPSGESQTSALGLQRYYNKADLIIVVGPTTNVSAWIGGRNGTAYPNAWSIVDYFLTNNQSFFDRRENKTIRVTDIDVNKLTEKIEAPSNPLGRPRIVYVHDARLFGNDLAAVRLSNGQNLPTDGLTVVTPNPLYVWGHYNVIDAHRGTTNTTQTKPASLVADAVTVLSAGWVDANSTNGLASRPASSTTVNAAVLTGIVPTDGTWFSGGLENSLRLLEHWGSATLTYNGSLAVAFPSAIAVAKPATPTLTVYWPPLARQFHFDGNFHQETLLPPGTPELRTVIRSRWAGIAANTLP